MTKLDTVLMRAGILKRSMDCKIPTKEKATPVNSTVGNMARVRDAARAEVSASYPSANSVTSGWANTIPSTVSTAVAAKTKGLFLPFLGQVLTEHGNKAGRNRGGKHHVKKDPGNTAGDIKRLGLHPGGSVVHRHQMIPV